MSETPSLQHEQLGLDETLPTSEKRRVVFEAIRDWVATDATFPLFKQPTSRKEEERLHIVGESEEFPRYELPLVTPDLLDNRSQIHNAFRQIVDTLYQDPEEDVLYKQMAEMRLDEIESTTRYFQRCVDHQEAHDAGNEALQETTGEALMTEAKLLYGEVDSDVFRGVVFRARRKVGESDVDGDIKEDLLKTLPDVQEAEAVFEIDPALFSEVRELMLDEWSEYLEIVENNPPVNGETYTAQERTRVYNIILGSFRSNGYEVETKVTIDEESTLEYVHQASNEIRVGGRREKPTSDEFKELIAHEVLTHALSRIKGENSSSPLIGLGLPGYGISQEALAKMAEQMVRGKYFEGGRNYYLAIGLIEGVQGEKMNAEQIHDFFWKLFLVEDAVNDEDRPNAITAAKEKAHKLCTRVFRSTTGKTKGVYYPKDLAYNNEKLWRHIADLKRDLGAEEFVNAIKLMFATKIDIYNTEQTEIAEKTLNDAT